MQGKEAEEYLKQGTMVPASMIIGEFEHVLWALLVMWWWVKCRYAASVIHAILGVSVRGVSCWLQGRRTGVA